MKKIILAVCLTTIAFTINAQVLQQGAVWSTFSVPQLKCWECKARLEQYLLHETGAGDDAAVFKVMVNMYNGTVRVQYAPDRITAAYIRTAIANAGFDADSIKANPPSYAKLPPVCKRKEEGGGPQKGKPCNMPPEGEN